MSTKQRNRIVGVAVALFSIGMGAVPYFFTRSMQQQGKNLSTEKLNLPGQAVVRGAYVNTGSRDAGPDPDWDPKTHSYKGRKTVRDSTAETKANVSG
jgi:hypothetical protein